MMAKAGRMTGPARCKHEKERSCIESNKMYIGDGLNIWKRRGNHFGRQKTAARCQVSLKIFSIFVSKAIIMCRIYVKEQRDVNGSTGTISHSAG